MFSERNLFACSRVTVIRLSMFSQVGHRADTLVKRKRGRKEGGSEGRKERGEKRKGGREGGWRGRREEGKEERKRKSLLVSQNHITTRGIRIL